MLLLLLLLLLLLPKGCPQGLWTARSRSRARSDAAALRRRIEDAVGRLLRRLGVDRLSD
jgi:hypothetical protein